MVSYLRNKIRKIILLLIMGFSFQGFVFAQQDTAIGDKLIGSTFKTLARVYVATVDLDKLKRDNIARLNRLPKEKFQKRYDEAYEVLKELPLYLRVNYNITEYLTQEQCIKEIASLDKKRIYGIIDSIPDGIIAINFKRYLSGKKIKHKDNIVEQIRKFWDKMIEKFNKEDASGE